MKRFPTWMLALALVAGCSTAKAPTQVTVKPKSSPSAAVATGRTLDFQVKAMASLADVSGKILNADPAGIVAQGAGNIVAQGAGNIVAQGAGNIVAQGAGNFQLLSTSLDGFVGVGKAVVHVEDLDGNYLSKNYVEADESGNVTLKGVPDGKPLLAVAQWKQGTTVRRTAAVVAVGTPSAPTMLDPINTFVQARVRAIVKSSGKSSAVTMADLKTVWSKFNAADIALDAKILDDDATLDDLTAFYAQEVGKLGCDDQAVVKAYMIKLGATASTACSTPAPDASATASAAATGTP